MQYTVLSVSDPNDLQNLGAALAQYYLYGLSDIWHDTSKQTFVKKFIDIHKDKNPSKPIESFQSLDEADQLEVITETLDALQISHSKIYVFKAILRSIINNLETFHVLRQFKKSKMIQTKQAKTPSTRPTTSSTDHPSSSTAIDPMKPSDELPPQIMEN